MSTHNIAATGRRQSLAATDRQDQYTLGQILIIWLVGSAPTWLLGWVAYPALSAGLQPMDAGLLRMTLLIVGLVWQFALALFILYRERGNIRLRTIGRRFWLNHPVSPRTGETNKALWWWIIPLFLVVVAVELVLRPGLNQVWTTIFPFFAEPDGYDLSVMFAPELHAQWVGAWGLVGVFLVASLFSNFLGEEFLFHGVLLPKMGGVFGKWDWVANGVLFGFYHLHQPWGILSNIVYGLIVAFAAKKLRSNWFPIIVHNGQAVYFLFLMLGLVLGLA